MGCPVMATSKIVAQSPNYTVDLSGRILSAFWLRALVYAGAFWSGFFVMGVELLGGRLLAPYFGSSVFVWGALIAVFMACLSVGYLIGGQLSLRAPQVSLLGLLMLTAGVFGLPLVALHSTLLEMISNLITDPRYGALVASIVLFAPATIVSGTVSPYAVRLLVSAVGESGRSAGFLYFVSTLGSAAGTILTSFYFVLLFEVNTILLAMIAMSCSIGLLLVSMGRK